ncbi:MAG TPA: AzlD domain-containing protein [Acidimicrobiia bacterium]|nr:AzlD domain-containing protein [Acidimicrobiia bacterium]
MSDLALVVTVAAITYATRLSFMLRSRPALGGRVGRFLDVFPLALFIAIATSGLAAPGGTPAVTPALAAAVGGVLGAIIFRRNLWGVLALGATFFYLARAVVG